MVVNKIDRDAARPDWVIDRTFELFMDLGATDEQCDFPVVYASGFAGIAGACVCALVRMHVPWCSCARVEVGGWRRVERREALMHRRAFTHASAPLPLPFPCTAQPSVLLLAPSMPDSLAASAAHTSSRTS